MLQTLSKLSLLRCLAVISILHAVESNTENKGESIHQILTRVSYSKSTEEPIKYPNKHKIKRAQLERFEDYYKCLDKFKMIAAAHYVIPGTTVRSADVEIRDLSRPIRSSVSDRCIGHPSKTKFLTGRRSLHCDACISPQGSSIQWEYANKGTNFTKKVLITDTAVNKHSQTLWSTQTDDGTILNLFRLSMKESGHYNCLQDGNVMTPHLVQIANLTETLLQVYPTTAPEGPYPSTPFNLTERSVRIWYEWNDWSECSRCDKAGERIRIGICTVTLFRDDNSSDANTLKIFPKGIPCRSNLLPTSLRNHPKILTVKNEYMVEHCQESCQKPKKYILRDTGGILLKKMANLSDPFTLLERLPHVSPPIQHSVLYLNQWETANIQCPGSDYNSAIAYWRLGLHLILSENERVRLGPTGILVVKNLVIADSNIYTCWQRNRLVGIVQLTVSQPIRLSFEEQLNTVVLVVIITSFLIITLRILRAYLKRRRLAKNRKKIG